MWLFIKFINLSGNLFDIIDFWIFWVWVTRLWIRYKIWRRLGASHQLALPPFRSNLHSEDGQWTVNDPFLPNVDHCLSCFPSALASEGRKVFLHGPSLINAIQWSFRSLDACRWVCSIRVNHSIQIYATLLPWISFANVSSTGIIHLANISNHLPFQDGIFHVSMSPTLLYSNGSVLTSVGQPPLNPLPPPCLVVRYLLCRLPRQPSRRMECPSMASSLSMRRRDVIPRPLRPSVIIGRETRSLLFRLSHRCDTWPLLT